MHYGNYPSPIGLIHIYADHHTLTHLSFFPLLSINAHHAPHPIIQQSIIELDEFFNGTRSVFTLPIEFQGTLFQNKVWTALTAIPYGTTVSYQDISYRINHPNAQRAIGQAVSRNPFLIIVPCHRVIRSTGEIGGYAGGQKIKQFLLELEKKRLK